MTYRTDLSRVQGLGHAGEGVQHFWAQRLSSVALIPLTLLFLIPFGRALGGGHEALVATYGQFGHALTAILFIAVACWHFAIGIQVVIEDYVHGATRVALIVLAKLFSATLAVAGILAVATILFRA